MDLKIRKQRALSEGDQKNTVVTGGQSFKCILRESSPHVYVVLNINCVCSRWVFHYLTENKEKHK